ncbi:kinase-like domain-containing protein, partial [Trametes elegans]
MSAPTTIPNLVGHLVEPYKLVELLRGGSHSAVYRAIDLSTASSSSGRDRRNDRAIKVLPKSDAVAGSLEIGLHSLVSGHPNIITMEDAFEDEDYYYVVLDLCPGGDLHTKIWDEHLFDHNDELVRSAFLQIVDSVEACHAASVYHRDIKPENILCSEDGSKVYLCDFGLARGRPISREFGSGTTNYMSPECLAEDIGRMPYTNARHDIWALGVVLVNMITASHPWSRASTEDDQFYDYLCDPNFLLEKFDISEGANDILRRIFVLNPMGRITLPELRASILELGSFF